jgi:hypothetical protein
MSGAEEKRAEEEYSECSPFLGGHSEYWLASKKLI